MMPPELLGGIPQRDQLRVVLATCIEISWLMHSCLIQIYLPLI